jgi:hypothetical protein
MTAISQGDGSSRDHASKTEKVKAGDWIEVGDFYKARISEASGACESGFGSMETYRCRGEVTWTFCAAAVGGSGYQDRPALVCATDDRMQYT